MDRSDIAYLVTKAYEKDDYGVMQETITKNKIFVQVNSVSGSEWFEGGRIGLNPSLRFTTSRFDYDDEDTVLYNGKYYTIYRTYLARNDTIELYCERRKGNADHQDNTASVL